MDMQLLLLLLLLLKQEQQQLLLLVTETRTHTQFTPHIHPHSSRVWRAGEGGQSKLCKKNFTARGNKIY